MAKGQPKIHVSLHPDDEHIIAGNLPVPSPGRNLPEEDKIKLARVVCELYSTDRYAIRTCLGAVGIKSDNTWHRWADQITEIGDLYKEAQQMKDRVYRSSLKQRARTSLERMVSGYVKELKEQVFEYRAIQLENGEEAIEKVLIAEKVKQVYIKPSPTLVQYALNNIDGSNFERSPERIPVESDRIDTPRKKWIDDDAEVE